MNTGEAGLEPDEEKIELQERQASDLDDYQSHVLRDKEAARTEDDDLQLDEDESPF